MAPPPYPMNPNKEAARWILRCMGCYQRVTSTDALRGNAYFALGGVWHAAHMACVRCKMNVAEVPFCETPNENNELMCTDCYMIEHNPNCTGCGKRLFETALDAAGNLYHKECLRCKSCKQICADGRFIMDDAGAIYDEDCYHLLVLGRDHGCNFGGSKGSSSSEKTEEKTSSS